MKRKLIAYAAKAIRSDSGSAFQLLLLNGILRKVIPFNAAHKIRITSVAPGEVQVRLPFTRANTNHLGGMHACAIAAAAEFSSGILLLRTIDFSVYRLIMKDLHVVYEKQGRAELTAICAKPQELALEALESSLATGQVCDVTLRPKVVDVDGATVALVTVLWQIKAWEQVGKG